MTQKIYRSLIGTSRKVSPRPPGMRSPRRAKTVRGIKWAHVDSLDMELDGEKVCVFARQPKFILMWRSESSLP